MRRKEVSKRGDRARRGPSNSGTTSSGQPHQAAQPPEHLQTAHGTEIPRQHPHLSFERGMTSRGHETFPNAVLTSGKKQAQAVLEATTASQMCPTLQMWRRAGCAKGRCWDWRAQGHPITMNNVQTLGFSLADSRTLSWTILWPGLVQSPELHPYQPKKNMEKTS